MSQQLHFLQIERRLLDKIRRFRRQGNYQGVTRILTTLQAVARDAYRARTGKRVPTVPQGSRHHHQITSYSRGVMAFGVSHVRKVCREMLSRYALPTTPLFSIGCGDARLQDDVLKRTDRPYYLVDPDPSNFMGRPPFLDVKYSDIRDLIQQLPKDMTGGGILFILWPQPTEWGSIEQAYDRVSLDIIPFDILVTIYTEDGTSGSEKYVDKINHLCHATRWYDILHDEYKTDDDITIRFLILIKKTWKDAMDTHAIMERQRKILELRRKYHKIDEWRKTIQSKMITMKDRDRDEFIPKAMEQIRLFCKRESLPKDTCKDIINYIIG